MIVIDIISKVRTPPYVRSITLPEGVRAVLYPARKVGRHAEDDGSSYGIEV